MFFKVVHLRESIIFVVVMEEVTVNEFTPNKELRENPLKRALKTYIVSEVCTKFVGE